MPTKKKHHKSKPKSTHKKKGRVGAFNLTGEQITTTLELIAGGVLGAVTAKIGSSALLKQFPNLSGTAYAWGVGGVQAVGGGFLTAAANSAFLEGVGIGVAINGAEMILTDLGAISGMMGYLNLRPQPNRVGMSPESFRQPPRLGAVTPQNFRRPPTVGRTRNRMRNMSVFAAGAGM